MAIIQGSDEWIVTSGIKSKFELWKEAMAQLRQLHGDVWNGVRFFLTVNSIIMAGIFLILGRYLTASSITAIRTIAISVIIGLVAMGGLILTIAATGILKKHRKYYLNMLLIKTLLDRELGFYETTYQGINLTFPWKVDKEHLHKLDRPDKWIADHMFEQGTISRWLWFTYIFVIVIYILIMIASIIGTMMASLILLIREIQV